MLLAKILNSNPMRDDVLRNVLVGVLRGPACVPSERQSLRLMRGVS